MIRRVVTIVSSWNIQRFSKKNSNALADEKGIALPFFVAFLTALLLCMALMVDLGRFMIARHEVQSIVDAASLAGASMTKVIGVYDSMGNPIDYIAAVDLPAAQSEAERVMNENFGKLDLTTKGIHIEDRVVTSPDDGQVFVEITYKVDTILLSKFDNLTHLSEVMMSARSIAEINL